MEQEQPVKNERVHALKTKTAEQLVAGLSWSGEQHEVVGELVLRMYEAQRKVPRDITADDVKKLSEMSARDLYQMTNTEQPGAAYQAIAKILFARMMRPGQEVRHLRNKLLERFSVSFAALGLQDDPGPVQNPEGEIKRICSMASALNQIVGDVHHGLD